MAYTRKTWKSDAWGSSTGTLKSHGTKPTRKTHHTGMSSNWTPSATYSPTKFTQYRKQLDAKIASFRTINQQFSGTAKVTAFSPTTANKWINFVNKGCWVYKFSDTDFNKHFGKYCGSKWTGSGSPTSAHKWLKKQYGTGVKAVTRGKGNNWLIAVTPKVSARPFSSYTWK